ncbi:MAG TPA: metallophosphoesterase family protein [Actinomycetota bacterium]|nr:metallophosphoesterase family protein [Actinomycetota bacterium]
MGVVTLDAPGAHARSSGSLRRYPYLTDLVRRNVTVNWATTTSIGSGSVRWGRPGHCSAHRTGASKTGITVGSTAEYQWKAQLTGLKRGKRYCYRVFGGSTNLLGKRRAPRFRTQIPRRSREPFSFAVFGDWGAVDAAGNNRGQAKLMSRIAASGATFAVTTGDTAYPSGSQTNYGDLVHHGADTSAIFGRSFWTKAGDRIPLFNAQGNHGMNATALVNWPQLHVARASRGAYAMQTYCCQNRTSSASYPKSWYAFNAGPARFYVLQASWADSNVGDTNLYRNDFDAHWRRHRAEFRWLRHDLRTHHRPIAFAFFHFPLYADNSHEGTDHLLSGRGSLEHLLGTHGVDLVFNGHAHIYERNRRSDRHMPISYVTGGGGAKVEPVSQCSRIDAYAIGWSASASTHGSRCGAARRPTSIGQVFHFLLVRVDGSTVTVTPTNANGHRFDVQTYHFG